MKFLKTVFLLLLLGTISYANTTNLEESSPAAKVEQATQSEPLPIIHASLTEEPEKNSTEVLSAKEKRTLEKLQKVWAKKEDKIKRRLAKKGVRDIDEVTFEDVVVLAGAIVIILGIISILFSPISAIISIILGLAVYLIGKGYGGSLDAFF